MLTYVLVLNLLQTSGFIVGFLYLMRKIQQEAKNQTKLLAEDTVKQQAYREETLDFVKKNVTAATSPKTQSPLN